MIEKNDLPHPRWILLAGLFLTASMASGTGLADSTKPVAEVETGRQIFLTGQLANGEALRAKASRGRPIAGREAACANCHRPSGMGGKLGPLQVPAITAKYLSSTAGKQAPRPAYDDASLSRVIRQGFDSAGRRLEESMPRYANLDEPTMSALLAYLKQLGVDKAGIDSHLHFATVFTPDIPPSQRADSLAVLQACVRANEKSGAANRLPWQLDVWELTGDAKEWPQQLNRQLAEKPVLALIGGGSREQWSPTASFCSQQRLPCLFAHVDAPPDQTAPPYSLYLSGGVKAEAAVLAKLVPPDRTGVAVPVGRAGMPGLRSLSGISRIVQVYPVGAGSEAATSLEKALATRGLRIENRPWLGAAATLATLPEMTESDLLVLWLRNDDLQALLPLLPANLGARRILLSDTLVNTDLLKPAEAWKSRLGVLSLLELKEKRHARSQMILKPWLQKNGLALNDERTQMAALTSCALLAGAVRESGEDLSRDSLLESVYTTAGSRSEPSHYPELRMSPGQTYASRGGRLLRYASTRSGITLTDESGWVLP